MTLHTQRDRPRLARTFPIGDQEAGLRSLVRRVAEVTEELMRYRSSQFEAHPRRFGLASPGWQGVVRYTPYGNTMARIL